MKPDEPDLTRDGPHHGDAPFWDRQLRARIGQDLRAIFQDTLTDPLPERVSRVLGQMEGQAHSGRPETGPDLPAS